MRWWKKGKKGEEAEKHADIDSRGICARSTRLGNLNVCTMLWRTYRKVYASRGMRIYISIHPMEERRRQGRGGLGGSSVATGEGEGGGMGGSKTNRFSRK